VMAELNPLPKLTESLRLVRTAIANLTQPWAETATPLLGSEDCLDPFTPDLPLVDFSPFEQLPHPVPPSGQASTGAPPRARITPTPAIDRPPASRQPIMDTRPTGLTASPSLPRFSLRQRGAAGPTSPPTPGRLDGTPSDRRAGHQATPAEAEFSRDSGSNPFSDSRLNSSPDVSTDSVMNSVANSATNSATSRGAEAPLSAVIDRVNTLANSLLSPETLPASPTGHAPELPLESKTQASRSLRLSGPTGSGFDRLPDEQNPPGIDQPVSAGSGLSVPQPQRTIDQIHQLATALQRPQPSDSKVNPAMATLANAPGLPPMSVADASTTAMIHSNVDAIGSPHRSLNGLGTAMPIASARETPDLVLGGEASAIAADTVADLVNDVLMEQARRQGVDLS
jgi:hypothetical protein